MNFDARYEVFNNVFAIFNASYSDIRAFDSTSNILYETEKTAAGYLQRFSSQYLQGKNMMITGGVNFGF